MGSGTTGCRDSGRGEFLCVWRRGDNIRGGQGIKGH